MTTTEIFAEDNELVADLLGKILVFVGTQATNVADKVAKRRHRFGENHPFAKYTEAQAKEVKQRIRGGQSNIEISRAMSVPSSLVSGIRLGTSWKHID